MSTPEPLNLADTEEIHRGSSAWHDRPSPADHKAMVVVRGFMGTAGHTYVSNKAIGLVLGITEGAVRVRLRRMERLGLITMDIEPNRRRLSFTDRGEDYLA